MLRRICTTALALAAFAFVSPPASAPVAAQGQTACKEMRKIDVGVAVSPPNVIHTVPYVAKELGFFAKHCVDANIVQFNGGTAGTIIAALQQGHTTANVTGIAIARGVPLMQTWQMAPRPPQAYVVGPSIKDCKDLKGKRLSAAGGGVGGFNWLMGREVLKSCGLGVDDAQFIAGDTAGRLPGLVAGQVDGVVLHPEDVYLAQKELKGAHVLVYLNKLLPEFAFNAYGISTATIKSDPALVRDTMAALIEGSRAIYRDKNKVIPIIVKATNKPQDAVEYAYDQETKDCNWAVNTGFVESRTLWTQDNDIADGYVKPEQKLPYGKIVDTQLAFQALKAAGGSTKIGNCTL